MIAAPGGLRYAGFLVGHTSGSDAELIGRTVGPYTLESVLGRGGMGTVFLARHAELDRESAVKVLSTAVTDSESALERFRREARGASRIRHPNAITIYDFGIDDGLAYLTMERLEGEELADRLARDGALSVGEFLRIFGPVCQAVHAGHGQGVVHRDIKPSNIFLDTSTGTEIVKVLDFGLATSAKSVVYQADPVLLRRIVPPEQVADTGAEVLMNPSRQLQGLSDLYLTGRFRLVEGAMPMTAEVTMKLPSGYDKPKPVDIALGDGQVDVKGSVLTGSYFSETGSLLRLEGGYNVRFNGPADQVVYEVKLGQFIGSKLLLYGGVRGAQSVGEERLDGEVTPAAVDPSVPAAEFSYDNIVFLPFSASKSYHLAEAGALVLSRSIGAEVGLSMGTGPQAGLFAGGRRPRHA